MLLHAQSADSVRFHADFISLNNDKKLVQDIYYQNAKPVTVAIDIRCYKYDKGDSICVYSKRVHKINFKEGTRIYHLKFLKTDTATAYSDLFYKIMKAGLTPPGVYKTFLSINTGTKSYQGTFSYTIDTLISEGSAVKRDINKSLLPKQRSFMGLSLKNTTAGLDKAGNAIKKSKNKMGKALKAKGLTPVTYEANGKSYVDLYCQEWFAGRYEVQKNESISGQINKEESMLKGNANALTKTDLGNYQTIFSQYKTLKKEQKQQDDVKGEISVAGNFSNGQEEYSDADDNYYELRGMLELPILGMPVQVEGFYTSQDKHREVKASYFHLHYDADKAKDELMQSVGAYKSKYTETQSKAKGMTQIYQGYLSGLESQKGQLLTELQKETGVKNIGSNTFNADSLKNGMVADVQHLEKDTTAMKNAAKGQADSNSAVKTLSGDEAKLKSAADEKYKKALDKYNKLQALDQKIEKYQALINQFNNTNYFDSVMAYDKVKQLESGDATSYKQMATRANNLLPDGKAKTFVAGIINFDAGIFPKYQSQYTMAGQNLKGADVGYDLGFCKIGVTAGKTEYAGRDGSMDQYTCYSGRAVFEPFKKQQLSLIYYGYTPDRKMFSSDTFFKNVDVSAPSFSRPVSIISATYNGVIAPYVTIDAEAATSVKQPDSGVVTTTSTLSADKMAYHVLVNGDIPKTGMRIDAGYDAAGKDFENNTLPVSIAGTQQFKIAVQKTLFHFLAVGVEYDHLLQNNYASSGGNTRWGFDVKYNSKKYPSLLLSYKPFTTFRSYSDTLVTVQQRPLIGSVWTGRASYQIKDHDRALRFTFIYNKSTSQMDTVNYGTTTTQLSCIYTAKLLTANLSFGNMQNTGDAIAAITTMPNNTNFISTGESFTVLGGLNLNATQDLGYASFGFCRYAIGGGMAYRFKKGMTLRLNMRYNAYELEEYQAWQKLYSGNAEVTWQFKTKLKN